MQETDPIQYWAGEWGDAYQDRNIPHERAVAETTEFFNRLFTTTPVKPEKLSSILEVGAGRGVNLIALRKMLGPKVKIGATELNKKAREELKQNSDIALDYLCDSLIYDIPQPDNSYDLVFVRSVFSAVPHAQIPKAIEELYRVSKRYILCVEYFSHLPEEVPYRGVQGILFKQDYGKSCLEVLGSKIKPAGYGFVWREDLRSFDNNHWWLFEKV